MGGKQCEHGIVPVTDCYVCVSAPTSALIVPRDFEAWLRSVLPDSVRRRCSIHELRQVWEERQAALAEARREGAAKMKKRCAQACIDLAASWGPVDHPHGDDDAMACAAAIRALDE